MTIDRTAYFARARAFLLAREHTTERLRWVAFEGGDHVFITPTGAEYRVDLVCRTVTRAA
jgi:hypothetical protein